nr:phospholipase d zeta 1 [Quercus suber]
MSWPRDGFFWHICLQVGSSQRRIFLPDPYASTFSKERKMVNKTSDVGTAQAQQEVANSRKSDGDGHQSFLKEKFNKLRVKATHLKHQVGKFENLVNTNHRHDEAHEQETDAKRTKIAEGHRFQSFAPERDGNKIKWYIDGRDYFHAVSVALERAKEFILIEDWWLSPELFLRRPPHFNQEWRLDRVLKRAAERGVKIYVVVYKEVEAAVSCNSQHTKHALEALCPEGTPGYKNIVVMRHPDHNVFENGADMSFYWAHHEKFIVIDLDLAFIGGLDLCFGRWDSIQHPLADAHPSGVQNEIFPGQDFNNNRIMDFKSVQDWKSNELSKAEYGRMPWHDVSMGVIGPCVYDITEHFILRWNFCKRDKYKRDERYDWLTLTGRTGDDEALVGVQRPKHPVGDYIHIPFTPLENKTGNPLQHAHLSQGGGNGDDEFLEAQEDVDEHGYTHDQHRRGHGAEKFMQEHGVHRPHLHHDDSENNDLQPTKQENAKVTGNNPKKEGTVSASGGLAEKSKGYSSTMVDSKTHGGQGTVHAQIVRSSADWSSGILAEQSIQTAYCQVIRDAKHFVYIENQFFITATGDKQAPVHNRIGAAIVDACLAAAKEQRKFRVIVMIPSIPGFAGDLRSDPATGTRAIMDYQYKSICRGEESIYGKIKAAGVDPTKYIFFFNLRSYDRLNLTPAFKEKEKETGMSYQDLQRAEAEEVMAEGVHGGPGEGSRKHPSADNRPNLDSNADDVKKAFSHGTQHTGTAGEGKAPNARSVDTIAKDAMLDQKKPSEEQWAGRPPGDKEDKEAREQEKENFVQEELYIHGKLLIVDDRIVICGSSNINDRSQLGFHDSELSIVMEDTLALPSKMNGQDYKAGHHAATLRRMLWREHLGLLPPQSMDAENDVNALPPGDGDSRWNKGDEHDAFVEDPLSDELWDMWTTCATTNTEIFRHLFHADPDNNIKTFEDYDMFMPKHLKQGHIFDPYQPVDVLRRELDRIKGHIVWMPLDFLRDAPMAEKGLQVNQITESVYT